MRFCSDVFLQSRGDIRVRRQMDFFDDTTRHLPFLVFYDSWEITTGSEATTEGDQSTRELLTVTAAYSGAVTGVHQEHFIIIF